MIEFKKVNFRYGELNEAPFLLKGVSFAFKKNKINGIIGKNGCGKSTIAKLAAGLIKPCSGQILVDGQECGIGGRVGLIFQNSDNQIVGTIVEEDMAFGLENLCIPRQEMHERIQSASKLLGIQSLLNEPVENLSGGQKQLLCIASVVVMRPSWVILDEPTSHLDPWAKIELWNTLNRLVHSEGLGVIVISQIREDFKHFENALLFYNNEVMLKEGFNTDKSFADEFYKNFFKIKTSFSLSPQSPAGSNTAQNAAKPTALRQAKAQTGAQTGVQIGAQTGAQTEAQIGAQTGAQTEAQAAQVLSFNNFSVSYGKKQMISPFSAFIKSGALNLLVGRAGVGKSTLLRAVAGFHNDCGGSILINNKPFNPAGLVSLVFQNPETLFFNPTVKEEAAFALKARNLSESEIESKTNEWLNVWGLNPQIYGKCHPLELSGGEKRRLALAACTIFLPPIILLDEPLSGLDFEGQNALLERIKEMCQTRIVLVVTHNPGFFLPHAHTVMLINNKTLTQYTSSEFIAKSQAEPSFYPL